VNFFVLLILFERIVAMMREVYPGERKSVCDARRASAQGSAHGTAGFRHATIAPLSATECTRNNPPEAA